MAHLHLYIRTHIQRTRTGFIDLGTVFSISFDFTMAQSFDERQVYSCIHRCIHTHECVRDICLIQVIGTGKKKLSCIRAVWVTRRYQDICKCIHAPIWCNAYTELVSVMYWWASLIGECHGLVSVNHHWWVSMIYDTCLSCAAHKRVIQHMSVIWHIRVSFDT